MYRNLLFQLIFLLITHSTLSKILYCTYNTNYLIFNNNIIRETISSSSITSHFAVEIPSIEDTKTDDTVSCYYFNEYPIAKSNLKDLLIKNNSYSVSNHNYTATSDHLFNIVGIFKASPLNYNSKPLFIELYFDNSLVSFYEMNTEFTTISFFEQIYQTIGYHSFKIIIRSEGIWCLCPSKGSGFENNKYYFAWTNEQPLLTIQELTILHKIDKNQYSVVV